MCNWMSTYTCSEPSDMFEESRCPLFLSPISLIEGVLTWHFELFFYYKSTHVALLFILSPNAFKNSSTRTCRLGHCCIGCVRQCVCVCALLRYWTADPPDNRFFIHSFFLFRHPSITQNHGDRRTATTNLPAKTVTSLVVFIDPLYEHSDLNKTHITVDFCSCFVPPLPTSYFRSISSRPRGTRDWIFTCWINCFVFFYHG